LNVPVGLSVGLGEDDEAVEDDDDDEESQGDVGGVGLEFGAEDEVFLVDILGYEGGAEAEEGDEDGTPGEKGGDGGETMW
jgi:hypothetical protein